MLYSLILYNTRKMNKSNYELEKILATAENPSLF